MLTPGLAPYSAVIAKAERSCTPTVSFRALAELDADVACFGHGRPVVGGATAALAAASINPTML